MVWHNPRAVLPEDTEFVAINDGAEVGYWGMNPDPDNDKYSFEGAVKAADDEKKAQSKRDEKLAKADKARGEDKADEDEKPAPKRRGRPPIKKEGDE